MAETSTMLSMQTVTRALNSQTNVDDGNVRFRDETFEDGSSVET